MDGGGLGRSKNDRDPRYTVVWETLSDSSEGWTRDRDGENLIGGISILDLPVHWRSVSCSDVAAVVKW